MHQEVTLTTRTVLLGLASIALGLGGCCGGGGKSCKAEVEYTAGNYSPAKPFVGKGGGSLESAAKTQIEIGRDPMFEAVRGGVYPESRLGR